jgi:hypothetical protein
MLHQFMDDKIYLCGVDARVHSLRTISLRCVSDYNKAYVNSTYKVEGITTRFYKFEIGAYI